MTTTHKKSIDSIIITTANRVLRLRRLGYGQKVVYNALRSADDEGFNAILLSACTKEMDRLGVVAAQIGESSSGVLDRIYGLAYNSVFGTTEIDLETAKRDYVWLGQAINDFQAVSGVHSDRLRKKLYTLSLIREKPFI